MNETPQDRFTFVVPARMASRRFLGKVLKALGGRAVLDWVYDNCSRSRFCGGVIV
jgi:CMP-2-keto-3-deoxyoctulosonic acid synthetase